MKPHFAALLLLVLPTEAAAQTLVRIDSDNKNARLEQAVRATTHAAG